MADPVDALSTSSGVPQLNPHPKPQCLSRFTRGLIKLLVAALRHLPLPLNAFVPQPWPTSPFNLATVLALSEGGFCVHY